MNSVCKEWQIGKRSTNVYSCYAFPAHGAVADRWGLSFLLPFSRLSLSGMPCACLRTGGTVGADDVFNWMILKGRIKEVTRRQMQKSTAKLAASTPPCMASQQQVTPATR